ncbi:hypothetical protein AAH994_15285 [Weeksellaceae bacterium A-14]
MKKILLILTLTFANIIYSQSNYKQIQTEKTNSQKIQTAKNFIQTYLNKCQNKDYTKFLDFKLASEFENFLTKNLSEVCTSNDEKLGKINLKNLNSAYKDKSSLVSDSELYIFDVNTEKNKKLKYLSVWVSKKNQIDGMVITSEKPLKKKN